MSRGEINQLIGLLNKVLRDGGGSNTQRRKQVRKRNKRAAKTAPPAGQPGMPSSTNPRVRNTRISGNEGSMRVSRQELCASITTGDKGTASQTISLDPTRSSENFPWLAGLATSWERIVWHSLRMSWRPAVGTTTDGMIAYALDYSNPPSSKTGPARSDVLSHTPVKDHPIWQSTDKAELVLGAAKLRSRAKYVLGAADLNDAAPGSVVVSVLGAPASKSIGELWLTYDISMEGPRKAGA